MIHSYHFPSGEKFLLNVTIDRFNSATVLMLHEPFEAELAETITIGRNGMLQQISASSDTFNKFELGTNHYTVIIFPLVVNISTIIHRFCNGVAVRV
jgi:hypothetical protein